MAKQQRKKRGKKRQVATTPQWHWWSRLQLVSIGGDSERSYILEYLALLMRSGMEMSQAMRAIRGEVRNPAIAYRVYQIELDVEAGLGIAEAFERSNLFRSHVISLMRVGEISGRLPENLDAIVEQQQKDRTFKSQLQSASLYPIFVLVITGLVGIGIAWFILPQLANVFSSLDMDLPLVTRIVIAVGLFLSDYGVVVVPSLIVGMIVGLYVVFFMPKTKIMGQWILFATPGIRRLIREVELSRFGSVLGALLSAGLPIDEALQALRRSTGFYRYQRLYEATHEGVVAGDSLEDVFDAHKHSRALIPAPIQQMVIAGQQSGELPQTLEQIGSVFEQKTEITTKNLSVIIEPMLLLLVWAGVLAVALSVILPVYNLVGNITNQPGIGGSSQVEAVEVIEVGGIVEEEQASPVVVEPPSLLPRAEVQSPTGTLNLREEPTTSAPIVTVLENGEELTVLSEENDWLQVTVNGFTGWVSSLYVQDLGNG